MNLYLEGGPHLRVPMGRFIRKAVGQNVDLKIKPCGPRDKAIAQFAKNPGSLLLIDSEGESLSELTVRLASQSNSDAADKRAFFMVQLMEAWFLSDRNTLQTYYGSEFNAGRLPANPNVEDIPKADVENGLCNATHRCSKGTYHKVKHAPSLLEQLNPTTVSAACPNFVRLVDFLRDHAAS